MVAVVAPLPAAPAVAPPAAPPTDGADPTAAAGVLEEELLEEDHTDAADFVGKGQPGATAGTGGVAASGAPPPAAAGKAEGAAPASAAMASAIHTPGSHKDHHQVRFAVPGGEGVESTNGALCSDLKAPAAPAAPGASTSPPTGGAKEGTTPTDRAARFGIPAANVAAAAAAKGDSGTNGASPAPALGAAEEEKRRKRARKFELGEKSAKELQAEEAALSSASRVKRAKADLPASPTILGAALLADGATASALAKAVASPLGVAPPKGGGSSRKLGPPLPLDEVELAKRARRAKRFASE